jgi:hypothetical protein
MTDGLLAGLKALGISGSVTTQPIDGDETRLSVYINGVHIGIWDTARKTFVD